MRVNGFAIVFWVFGLGNVVANESDSSDLQQKIELATQLVQIDGSITQFEKERQFAETQMRNMGASEEDIAKMIEQLQPMVDLQMESLIQAYTDVATIAQLKSAIQEMKEARTAVALYERVFPVFIDTMMRSAQEHVQDMQVADTTTTKAQQDADIDLASLNAVQSNRFAAWLPVSPGAAYRPESKMAWGHDYPESITLPLQDSLLSDIFPAIEIEAHVVGDDARISKVMAERVFVDQPACADARKDVTSRLKADFVMQSQTDCGDPIYASEDDDFKLVLHCRDSELGELSSVTLVMEVTHKPTEAFMDKLWDRKFREMRDSEDEDSGSQE